MTSNFPAFLPKALEERKQIMANGANAFGLPRFICPLAFGRPLAGRLDVRDGRIDELILVFGLRALVFVRSATLNEIIQVKQDIKDQSPKTQDRF
jgi:hypothetical protein